MKNTCFKYVALAVTGILIISSCKVSETYKRPNVNVTNLYRDNPSTDSNSMAAMPWRSLFADTILQGLIQEGIDHNLDLKTAVLKIAEADATIRESKAAFLPSLDAGVSAAKAKASQASQSFSGIPLNTTTYQAKLTASWEVNVWGQLSSLKRQAVANFLESDASKRAVQTQLIADIANDYYILLAYDRQLEITRQTVKNDSIDVATNKILLAGNVVTGAAIVQSEANEYAAAITIPDIEQNIRQVENALCVLLTRAPGPIMRNKLEDQQPITTINAGVSTQLLRNRPDIQAAEFSFMSAFENTNVAHSYFYPTLTITADGGLSTLHLKDFFINSIFYDLVGGLTQPLLNKGQNKARYRIAKAQQLEAFNNYQKAILTAAQDVSNALFSYKGSLTKQQMRVLQIQVLEKSVDFTQQLLRYSSATNFTDVLTSEQNLLAAQLSGVNDRLQQLQAIVNLYQALGGGWK